MEQLADTFGVASDEISQSGPSGLERGTVPASEPTSPF
jgi:hypothetical protein